MGYYIDQTTTGAVLPAKGKVQSLIEDGAQVVPQRFVENLICVVDNGPFEAAAYCFSEKEFENFNRVDDRRPKTWLVHSKAKQLSGMR